MSSCWKTRRAGRAQGRAHGDLLATAQGAGEEEVADVGAGDEQDEADCRQQHQERGAHPSHHLFLERDHGAAPARVFLRVLLLQPPRDDLDLALGPGKIRPWSQPGDGLQVVVLAHGAIGVGEPQGNPDLAGRREPRGHAETFGHDPDDRVRLAIQLQGPAEDVRRGAHLRVPEPVADDHHARSRNVLVRAEQPPLRRLRAQDLEEARPHRGAEDGPGAAAAREREGTAAVHGHVLERRRSALPVVEVGRRQGEDLHAGKGGLRRHVEEAHEPVRLRERERTQEHGVQDAEYRGIGADAESEDGGHR